MPTLHLLHGLPRAARGSALGLLVVAPLFLALLLLSIAPLAAQPADLRVHKLTPAGETFSDLSLEENSRPFLSPDGRWVGFWFDGDVDDVFDLYVASRFGGDTRRLSAPRPPGSHTPGLTNAAFTSDSRYVVFRIDQETSQLAELWSVPVDGDPSDAVKVSGEMAPGFEVGSYQLTPDGQRVVFTRFMTGAHGLWSAPVDGGAEPVRLHPAGSDDPSGFDVRILGDTVLFRYSPVGGQRQLWRVPANGSSSPVRVSGDLVAGGQVTGFEPTEDGTRVVYRADARFDGVEELWSAPISGPPSAAVLLSPDLPAFGDVDNWRVNLPAGRVLFRADSAVDGQLELWSVPLAGPASAAVRLNTALVASGDVDSYSSFGEHAVYVADDLTDDVYQAYSVPIVGPFTAAQRLHGILPSGRLVGLAAPLPQSGPGNPDPLVLMVSNLRAADKAELFLQTLDAADDPYPLFDELPAGVGYRSSCGSGGPPDFSAIVVCADLGIADRIAVYRLDLELGSTPELLSSEFAHADADATRIVVSPDGRWTAYRADEVVNERFDLMRVRTDGSAGPQRVHATPASSILDVDPDQIRFTADSQGLVYAADHEVNEQLDLWISDAMIFVAGFEIGNTGEWSSDTPRGGRKVEAFAVPLGVRTVHHPAPVVSR